MRGILFRGKTSKDEWVYGDLIEIYGDGLFIHDKMCHTVNIRPETAGQYTGLTDENETRIFEGDIVKVEYTGANKGLDGIAKVVFDSCKFALVWGWHKEIVCLTDFCNVTFEIIGNIHDNPELLKSEVDTE